MSFKGTYSLVAIALLCFINVYSQDIGKLPYCSEKHIPGLVLVSTLDGKFSAITSEGSLLWQIETGPGPLLTSNIHNLELTNNGKWIRIIPSLTGTLYRFDGSTIDPIPITADSLLKASFKYSDDLVIAGGYEVRTYGVGFRSGKLFYVCSATKCTNNTENENDIDDILLIERSTQIVRAIDGQNGYERWNFSVGHHNIKLPQITCIDQNAMPFNWNISAIIPDGLLLASNFQDNVERIWQYHFSSPIVRVWKWNGKKINEVNLFTLKKFDAGDTQYFPSIYIGMHKKQLYIYESAANGATEAISLAKIPWKPISASGIVTEDDLTSLSVLYSSEYVNGQGYYLYSENDLKSKNNDLCEKNFTLKIPFVSKENNDDTISYLLLWWKEIIVLALTMGVLFHYMFKTFFCKQQQQKEIIIVERDIDLSVLSKKKKHSTMEMPFNSRYLNDFDTLHCLGKGGFGIVFEVKQKIDECHYAIKRISLPNEEHKKDAVMREVKALAKLEHNNIVRYFNSWVETPPHGWHQEHDSKWIDDDDFSGTMADFNTFSAVGNNSICVKDLLLTSPNTKASSDCDSFIVFEENSKTKSDNTNNTVGTMISSNNDTLSSLKSDNDSIKTNWRRPSCRHHSLNNKQIQSLPNNSSNQKPPVFLYIQMQLCQKQSLKEWLIEKENRQMNDILNIFKQIVSAVEYVHLQGLIHRDLKPSNIFFSLDGQIKIGDFGLVKDDEECLDHSSISSGSFFGHTKDVGTRLYMSPEQMNGRKYSYKIDIYSLGVIFFELLVYFSTHMERVNIISGIRENLYPKDFMEKYPKEYELLKMMLCKTPEKRLTTFGIRARPPINTFNDNSYDYELPKTLKTKS